MERQQAAGEVQQGVKQEQQAAGGGAAPRPVGGAAAAAAAGAGPSRPPAACQQLWVEKWRPKAMAELVGNNVRLWELVAGWLAVSAHVGWLGHVQPW